MSNRAVRSPAQVFRARALDLRGSLLDRRPTRRSALRPSEASVRLVLDAVPDDRSCISGADVAVALRRPGHHRSLLATRRGFRGH